MIPDFPHNIRTRLAQLNFFCCAPTLLSLCPVGCLSLAFLNWDSQQGTVRPKGQLISKCLSEITVWTKTPTKILITSALAQHRNCQNWYFGPNDDFIKTFWNYLTFTVYLINTDRKRVSIDNDNIHIITLVIPPSLSNFLKAIASDVP